MKEFELLAPAGGITQYIAAVENGADAIYVGGSLYNARMNAANFTLAELTKAVDYGHLRGVKTYVTMNTLLTDEELKPALEYAKKLYQIGVDALIIQDLGLGSVIKKAIPNFELHLSTQGTVYNKEGASRAKELGYDRVVLAREVNLEDIKSIAETGVDIECFIHGALCYSYSGQCQLSRYIGGRSGNKGGCAQPCRLAYLGGETPNPLSPKDLSMIDNIGKLIDLGVKSFKIEGRMKAPEYVATVVRIYRKYIDLYLKDGTYEVSREDRMDLIQAFNRGGFTVGYLNGNPGKSLLSGSLSKNQGILVGEAIKQSKNGLLIDAIVYNTGEYDRLKMGDVIEVHSNEMFTTKVTYFKELDDGTFRIGDMKSAVLPGDKIYRIVSDELTLKAKATFENIEISGHYIRKTPVDFKFIAKVGFSPKLSASAFAAGKRISVEKELADFILAEGVTRWAEEDEIEEKLSKTGGTPFALRKLDILMDKVFMPISKINELRRMVLDELTMKVIEAFKREPDFTDYEPKATGLDYIPKYSEIYFYSFEDLENSDIDEILSHYEDRSGVRILLPIMDVVKDFLIVKAFSEKHLIRIIPYIPNVVKGDYDEWLNDKKDDIVKAVKALSGEIYVGNLGEIELLKGDGISLLGDFGLNIYNEESFRAYESLGITRARKSLEDVSKDFGSFPLMITEHEMPNGVLTDRKGAKYNVRYYPALKKTIIRGECCQIDWEKANGDRIYLGSED